LPKTQLELHLIFLFDINFFNNWTQNLIPRIILCVKLEPNLKPL
jgi:hypothetical protein